MFGLGGLVNKLKYILVVVLVISIVFVCIDMYLLYRVNAQLMKLVID